MARFCFLFFFPLFTGLKRTFLGFLCIEKIKTRQTTDIRIFRFLDYIIKIKIGEI